MVRCPSLARRVDQEPAQRGSSGSQSGSKASSAVVPCEAARSLTVQPCHRVELTSLALIRIVLNGPGRWPLLQLSTPTGRRDEPAADTRTIEDSHRTPLRSNGEGDKPKKYSRQMPKTGSRGPRESHSRGLG